MRLLNDAISDCLALSPQRESAQVALADAYGYILSRSVIATRDLPHWSQSAMDGYAVRASEASQGAQLRVGEVIPAGHWPTRDLAHTEAARIFTGAPVPAGADAVLIQENVTPLESGEAIQVKQSSKFGEHIRVAGEEISHGDLLASCGERVSPGLLGLFAAQGIAHVDVFSKPKVALLETGTELVQLGQALKGAQIYGTNAITLGPMIERSGGRLVSTERVHDQVDAVVDMIKAQISSRVKLLITTGGVSVGDFDPIHESLERLGATRSFWKVKMKPGKPVSVSKVMHDEGHTLIIGLPGNPVSCVVTYLLFVHPLIQHLSGSPREELGLRRVKCRLTENISKRHHRAELFRVLIQAMSNREGNTFECRLTGGQSSGWISSIAKGDGLLYVSSEPCELEVGDQVEVALFPWRESALRKLFY